jgi:hypothetical protein
MEYLARLPPSPNFKNIYYYYFATPAVYHFGGELWQQWNPKMRDMLIDSQDMGTDPNKRDQKGSWNPEGDAWGGQLGRLGYTSLALLTLEVYYRRMPLGKELEQLLVKPEPQPEPKPAPKPADIPALVAGLADKGQRDAASTALVAAGKDAVGEVMKALDHQDVYTRLAAIHVLAGIGPGAVDAIPKLSGIAKNDSSATVRGAAVTAMARIQGK